MVQWSIRIRRWTCDQQVAASTSCRHRLWAATLGNSFTQSVSCATRQYNLVPV